MERANGGRYRLPTTLLDERPVWCRQQCCIDSDVNNYFWNATCFVEIFWKGNTTLSRRAELAEVDGIAEASWYGAVGTTRPILVVGKEKSTCLVGEMEKVEEKEEENFHRGRNQEWARSGRVEEHSKKKNKDRQTIKLMIACKLFSFLQEASVVCFSLSLGSFYLELGVEPKCVG